MRHGHGGDRYDLAGRNERRQGAATNHARWLRAPRTLAARTNRPPPLARAQWVNAIITGVVTRYNSAARDFLAVYTAELSLTTTSI